MNYFLQVLREKYAVFNGRARRAEFWQFFLFAFILAPLALELVLSVIATILNLPLLFSLVFIYYLAILIPTFAAISRRLHDTGKSFWFYFIPIYNIILLCTEGDKSPNEYGPDPKAVEHSGVTSPTF